VRDPRFAQANAWEQHNRVTAEQIAQTRIDARTIAIAGADCTSLQSARSRLDKSLPGCWHAFHEEFISAVREAPDRQEQWTLAIGTVFSDARDSILSASMDGEDRRGLRGAAERWRREWNPLSVWRHHSSHFSFWRDELWYWGMLFVYINPEEGLRALDAIPHPWLVEEILSLHFREDRELIEEMIRAAPPVFDAHGTWVAERTFVALLVTEMITTHAMALREAISGSTQNHPKGAESHLSDSAIQDLESRELPAWLRRAYGLLLQRSDGLQIALGYLGRLSREVMLGRGRGRDGQEQWNAYSASLVELVAILRPAGVSVAKVRATWVAMERLAEEDALRPTRRSVLPPPPNKQTGRQGEGAQRLRSEGLPLLVGAAVMLEAAPNSSAEIECLWSWFEELLVGRDPALSLTTHGTSLQDIPQRLGFLISRLPDPSSCIHATYLRLEPQRRRAQFSFRYEDYDIDIASVILLRVALNAAVNWQESEKDEAGAARELFYWIYGAARRLWLTAVLDTNHRKVRLVTVCFAFMPFLFSDALDEALKQVIPPIAGDSRLLAEACAMLSANKVEPTLLAEMVTKAGANLRAALHDTRQWAELTGHSEYYPDSLRSLAEKLQLESSEPRLLPQADDMAQRLVEFRRLIPWGSSLLDKLAAEGCTSPILAPMGEPGKTWLIQARLSETLRAHFGLSPEIRVLVVNGQVRGADLRRAIQEPEGAAQVDPDLLVIANDRAGFPSGLSNIVGPWGQRVPLAASVTPFPSLVGSLEEYLPTFNLFDRLDPVRGRALIGRGREMNSILPILLQGRAVGIFGLRKVGKSSLLSALAERIDPVGASLADFGVRAKVPSDAQSEGIVVRLDVQSLVVRTREALADRLFDALTRRLRAAGILATTGDAGQLDSPVKGPQTSQASLLEEMSSVDPLEKLRRLLSIAMERHAALTICFMIDEYDLLFEGYSGQPAVKGVEQIFALLRSFSQSTGRVSLALAGRDPIFVTQPLLNGFTNPLLGWIQPEPLGPFTPDDGSEAIRRIGRRVGLDVGPTTVDLALRWTGGHPLLLRQFGAAVFEIARQQRDDAVRATDTIVEQAVPVFRSREAVHTICGEIEVLLTTRFPEALSLLRAVAEAPDRASTALECLSVASSRAVRTLYDLGLVIGSPRGPGIPLLYREHFKPVDNGPKSG